MTAAWKVPNFAASVRQRLLNIARRDGIDYNRMLQRYAIERFLYRLSASRMVDRFTLKGATLLLIWTKRELRPTWDIDFLAVGSNDHDTIRTALKVVCSIPCPEDGVVFDPASVQVEDIRADLPYGGVRAQIKGNLGRARLNLQVDIGFGDVITPKREQKAYPTLLELPPPSFGLTRERRWSPRSFMRW